MNPNEIFHTIKNTPRLEVPVSAGFALFFGVGCMVLLPLAIAWAAVCYLIFKFGKDEVPDERAE